MKFKTIESWSYTEFPRICSEMKRVSSRKMQWLKMIEAGKLECPVTKLRVHTVALDEHPTKKGVTYHYNFYSECGRLFTVDHIIPKSKGGSKMNIKNLQPMIAEENWAKSNKLYKTMTITELLKKQGFKVGAIKQVFSNNQVRLNDEVVTDRHHELNVVVDDDDNPELIDVGDFIFNELMKGDETLQLKFKFFGVEYMVENHYKDFKLLQINKKLSYVIRIK